MNNSTRHAKIVETLTKNMRPGWFEYDIPRIGHVAVNCMTPEMASYMRCNQCWVRMGSVENHRDEFRGTAEAVAAKLLTLLKAPSKAVAEAAEVVLTKRFDGFRVEEMAVLYGLDEDTLFRAMDYLAERGQAVSKGDMGWFRV